MSNSVINYFLNEYYILMVIVVAFYLLIVSIDTKYFVSRRNICIFLVLDFMNALANTGEYFTGLDVKFYYLRIFFVILGYTLQVLMATLTLKTFYNKAFFPKWLYVPAIIDIFICMTAFFSDVVFGYDENYMYVRGPLGLLPIFISFLYIFILLIMSVHRIGKRDMIECSVIVFLGLIILITTVLQMTGFLKHDYQETVFVVCIVFYYYYHYMQAAKKDVLTKLLNRQSYYDCIISKDSKITGLIAIDMNGLKEINDTKGHKEGDISLQRLADVIIRYLDGSMRAYRVGGDEFNIILMGTKKVVVENYIKKVKNKTNNTDYSCSVGYALRLPRQSIIEVEKQADNMMYEDKRKHYELAGIDRRRR
ncbi:diguanylate cyclase (GGDEF) domain-containing protein [Acetitomaculum ruminis DSM 5522]|uniref:Diguanylate cyclase (GGDEF) domain-containing protein n=1 Tax=Acetitomaculum ruminis DSM 5522 TaxID=1120918 RepID=A0A1I0VQ66_9FIRM|nr:GGDEF domain-containing protein [Acetitomaculum ruminis]SFA78482.1 diguanylate cyclase (GGDEF) domain-containing protein [Acetitomaculum ruminis DSM 5522]